MSVKINFIFKNKCIKLLILLIRLILNELVVNPKLFNQTIEIIFFQLIERIHSLDFFYNLFKNCFEFIQQISHFIFFLHVFEMIRSSYFHCFILHTFQTISINKRKFIFLNFIFQKKDKLIFQDFILCNNIVFIFFLHADSYSILLWLQFPAIIFINNMQFQIIVFLFTVLNHKIILFLQQTFLSEFFEFIN